jgi:LysR family transcriptional regulator, glycine cleavage system transcriptional activator
MLRGVPLIHDDSFSSRAVMPNWADWFAAAGVRDADVSHGLRFNSADHALDATVEGAGVLLAHDALAYDDLRTGRLVAPFDLTLQSGRCYCFVCAKKRRESPNVQAFRAWLKDEAAAVDRSKRPLRAANSRPPAELSASRK